MFNKKLKERVERLEEIQDKRLRDTGNMKLKLMEMNETDNMLYTSFNEELMKLLERLNNKVKYQEKQIELLMEVCEPLIVKKTHESLETLANGLASAFDELASNVAKSVKPKATTPKKPKKPVDKSTSSTTAKKKATKKENK